ncbi:MAG: aspartate-semialdehyde dehydrogenase [Gemmatimonadota bacterium]
MRVAVLGATGAVGRTMLSVLEERAFPVTELVPLASERSAGERLPWHGKDWTIQLPSAEAFAGCDVALFSAGATRSKEWGPVAAAQGAVVIDNSSGWRMDQQVPLVVPEVNGRRVRDRPIGIIANPNCATIQLVVALEALRRAAGLTRVVATTFQSVSGAGQKGIATLDAELNGGTASESPFVGTIAHNVVPWIGPRGADGWNEEENKVRLETRKILELPDLPVASTCVRVPVRVGHSISVTAELDQPLTRDQVMAALEAMPGLIVDRDRDPLPRDVAGTDCVRVGHVRIDPDLPNVVHLWVVADNLRKGAATNAVQIAEDVLRG